MAYNEETDTYYYLDDNGELPAGFDYDTYLQDREYSDPSVTWYGETDSYDDGDSWFTGILKGAGNLLTNPKAWMLGLGLLSGLMGDDEEEVKMKGGRGGGGGMPKPYAVGAHGTTGVGDFSLIKSGTTVPGKG